MTCKDKLENNGTCPHHNLQCGWPKCNEPEQEFVGCIPSHWVDKAKQIANGPIAYPDAERAHQAIALIKILLKSTPPQRTWVVLTQTQVKLLWEGVPEEAIKSGDSVNWIFYTHINEALKERNT